MLNYSVQKQVTRIVL